MVVLVFVIGLVILQSNWHDTSAIDRVPCLVTKNKHDLAQVVVDNYHRYRGNSIRWSAVYFGCLFGAAAFSALSALLLKLEILAAHPRLQKDLPAILATLAALLITLTTSGDFARKWQANRIAASDMENLAYDLLPQRTGVDMSDLVQRMQTINTKQNLVIVGTE